MVPADGDDVDKPWTFLGITLLTLLKTFPPAQLIYHADHVLQINFEPTARCQTTPRGLLKINIQVKR